MNNNMFLKIFSSFPVILIFLYFIPFVGVCLLILRFFVYNDKKNRVPLFLLSLGLIIVLPKIIEVILNALKYDLSNIPYFSDIINSSIYSKNLIDYSKTLFIVGILYYIVLIIYNKLSNKVSAGIKSYMEQDLKREYQIRKENDMKMQEKREIAKNTHVVYCPYCGSDNMLTESTGTCKYCRRKIEYRQEK